MSPQTIGKTGLLDPAMPAQEMLLHMGEMRSSEMSAARAAIGWANEAIRRSAAAALDGIEAGLLDQNVPERILRRRLGPLRAQEMRTARAAIGWANTRAGKDDARKHAGIDFRDRVGEWLIACFGQDIAANRLERNHRFLEEALELVQSLGCTASEAHQLVDYVFGRDIGEPFQEVGGVLVTLAALCHAHDLEMQANGETELARVLTKIEKIRAKQAAKPKHSPLPAHVEQVALDRIKAAIEPVLYWYQSDEHEDRPIEDILRDIVEDLQEDRADNIRMRRRTLTATPGG